MKNKALKELLFKMADDELIIGHRNSEWTGIGPTMEEDISFSSMSQDKIGHAFQLYKLLHELGERDPDYLGFLREAQEYRCCHLVELPIGEYDFSLVRHFLFDHAEYLRYQSLKSSSYQPLANLAAKFEGEIKYHIFHADMWMKSLMNGTEESKARIQNALNSTLEMAKWIFNPGPHEAELIKEGVFIGEEALFGQWYKQIKAMLSSFGLTVPQIEFQSNDQEGRYGVHTEHLQPLLNEMSEVLKLDTSAEW